MTNIFEVKKQYNEFIHDAIEFQHDLNDFINESMNELKPWNKLITDTTKKYLGYLYSGHEVPEHYPDDLAEEYLEILNDVKKYQFKKYSRFNMIVAYRFYVRKFNKLDKELRELKVIVRDYWGNLKEIESGLLELRYKHNVNEMLEVITQFKETMAYYKNFEFANYNGKHLFDGLFVDKDNLKNTITKNEMLSILTIEKSKEINEIINQLPEQIDIKTFWDVVFLDNIEDFSDNYCSDVLFDQLIDARKNSPELKKRMDDKLFELVPDLGLHTFDVKFDQYGDVASIEKSKPRLMVMDGGIDYNQQKISQ